MTVEIFELFNRRAVIERHRWPRRYYEVTLTRRGNIRTSIRAEQRTSIKEAMTLARKWVKA